MDIFLIRLLQFMLAIGLLVLLHEGGHFFFSKLFGVRVDKFYLFFDPGIGKSTLLLQASEKIAGKGKRVLYISRLFIRR